VRLIEVDVVGLQPGERCVDRLVDVLGDRPLSFGPPGPVAPKTLVRLSRRSAAKASPRIVSARPFAYVFAVSNVVMPASSGAGGRLIRLDLPAMRDPVAVADRGHFQAAVAEKAKLHWSSFVLVVVCSGVSWSRQVPFQGGTRRC